LRRDLCRPLRGLDIFLKISLFHPYGCGCNISPFGLKNLIDTEKRLCIIIARQGDIVKNHQLKLVALPYSGFACPPLAGISIHQWDWWFFTLQRRI
jgi:hypothetical protein